MFVCFDFCWVWFDFCGFADLDFGFRFWLLVDFKGCILFRVWSVGWLLFSLVIC